MRRARPSEASRFQQLFEQNWRGFHRLDTLWSHPIGGSEAVWRTKLLATKVPSSSGQLVESTVRAVDLALDALLPSLDTGALATASNEDRTKEILPKLAESLSLGKDKTVSTSSETWGTFISSAPYRALFTALEAFDVVPLYARRRPSLVRLSLCRRSTFL